MLGPLGSTPNEQGLRATKKNNNNMPSSLQWNPIIPGPIWTNQAQTQKKRA